MDRSEKLKNLQEAFDAVVQAEDYIRAATNKLRRAVRYIDKAGGAGAAAGQLEAYTIAYLKSFTGVDNIDEAGNLEGILDLILEKMDELEEAKNEG